VFTVARGSVVATVAMVVVARAVATAVVVATAVMTTIVAALGILVGFLRHHALGNHFAGAIAGESRGTHEQRGNENKGHWAFHLRLLGGSRSIRYGASIGSRT
jgi:hypothetical protein